jgi:hypothetical protein
VVAGGSAARRLRQLAAWMACAEQVEKELAALMAQAS